MGNNNSSQKKVKNVNKSPKLPPVMPYKRQFSSETAREQQACAAKEFQKRQSLNEECDDDDQKSNRRTSIYSDVLDPKKYQPPPSPFKSDAKYIAISTPESSKNIFNDTAIEETESLMTAEEAMQIKQNTERGMSPGLNIIHDNENDSDTNINTKKNNSNINSNRVAGIPSSNQPSHKRVESQKLENYSTLRRISNAKQSQKTVIWGYCELTRKQLDEDQAAFLTWTHVNEGLVHAWAVFDGHGGYETALYSAQHFLKYLEKYHHMKKNISNEEWPKLMKEIFCRFDEHVGNLKVRGGSTVVVVLLIKTRLIIANAGDARAIYSNNNGSAMALSYDHSPMNDYHRLMEVCTKPKNFKQIKKYFRINGKNETKADFACLSYSEKQKAPFINRELDKSRFLGTIGVARGFGDYTLSVFGFKHIHLKQFLSAEPYVNVVELSTANIKETDVMCIACDGIYDVMSNQEVIDTLRREIYFHKPQKGKEDESSDEVIVNTNTFQDAHQASDEVINKSKLNLLKNPNLSTTHEIIDRACGFLGLRAYAKGTMDDVTAFVIPLKQIFAVPH